MSLRLAVLIPCHNEAMTIGQVVSDFRRALPAAKVYVYDNNSADETAVIAQREGALLRVETSQGKGHVVCRMFSEVEADIYVLVDGDATYDAGIAPALVKQLVANQLDMLCAARQTETTGAYRLGHRTGNRLLSGMVAWIFGNKFSDMLTGYRVFSRRFVKSFPALSSGFEIETQLTIHALEMQMRVAEVNTEYFERPLGSISKLRTFGDGWRILWAITYLIKDERPMMFFSSIFAILVTLSLLLAFPVVIEYGETGMVRRFPTAFLAMGTMLLAFLCLACGLILDTVSKGRREVKRLHYLATPSLSPDSISELPKRLT